MADAAGNAPVPAGGCEPGAMGGAQVLTGDCEGTPAPAGEDRLGRTGPQAPRPPARGGSACFPRELVSGGRFNFTTTKLGAPKCSQESFIKSR